MMARCLGVAALSALASALAVVLLYLLSFLVMELTLPDNAGFEALGLFVLVLACAVPLWAAASFFALRAITAWRLGVRLTWWRALIVLVVSSASLLVAARLLSLGMTGEQQPSLALAWLTGLGLAATLSGGLSLYGLLAPQLEGRSSVAAPPAGQASEREGERERKEQDPSA